MNDRSIITIEHEGETIRYEVQLAECVERRTRGTFLDWRLEIDARICKKQVAE